jgi:nitric oxide reductase NorE protein
LFQVLQEPDSVGTVPAKLSAHSLSGSRIPGDKDVWFLIIAEMMTFGVFFVTYMVYRAKDVELFNASQLALNRNLALLNTLFLVTSSWTVAQAVTAARQDRPIAVRGYLLIAISLAVAFMTAKCLEYSIEFERGITATTNMFFTFYFCLTLIHMLHVIVGTVILSVVWMNARRGAYRPGRTVGMETAASYWHMVDLLWIFLFPLLYLLR